MQTANKIMVTMDGFMVIDTETNELAYFGTRSQCRDFRAANNDNGSYSAPLRVTKKIRIDG